MTNIWLLLVGCVISTSTVYADDSIAIKGRMEFWLRTCNDAYQCDLPTAISPAIEVDGTLPKPTADKNLTKFEYTAKHDHLEARLQIYWRIVGDQPHEHYLTAQIRLIDVNTKTIITECTHYDRDSFTTYFPVGACSGTLNGAGIGITTKKYPETTGSHVDLR